MKTAGSIILKILAIAVIVVIARVVLLLLFFGGSPKEHYGFDLPGGYRCRTTSYSGRPSTLRGVVIEYKNRDFASYIEKYHIKKFIIGPIVSGYHVYTNTIVGQITRKVSAKQVVDDITHGFSFEMHEMRPGYFIIEQRTKRVYGGLSKSDWMKKLKTFGITEEPMLHKPAWLDGYFGWNKPSDR